MLKAAPKILQTVRVMSYEMNFHEYRKGMTQFDDLHAFLKNNNFELHAIWGQTTGIYIKK